jgi:hypothetical protein
LDNGVARHGSGLVLDVGGGGQQRQRAMNNAGVMEASLNAISAASSSSVPAIERGR